LILSGVLTLEEAASSVDYRTVVLLFGMMIVAANLRLAGFFRLVTAWSLRRARSPVQLLAATVAVAGVLAAFLINDVVCLVVAPLIVQITRALRLPPIPYLIALATAANIGSVATVTGNPQNMLVAGYSGIDYRSFALHLAPLAVVGLVIDFGVLWLFFRGQLRGRIEPATANFRIAVHRPLLIKSTLVTLLAVALFLVGWPVSDVALGAGAWLLVTRRVRPAKVYREIDWTLLVLFVGLFVVVGGLEHAGIDETLFGWMHGWGLERSGPLVLVVAVLSNVVSNVPAVMVLKPFASNLPNPEHAWLTVAAASTFAGNLTTLGSVANLIVIEQARRAGIEISFFDYVRVGLPVTALTLASIIVLVR
jgi:Na+/H+ antiporter NhaD/arsenite permease-like protein